MRHVAGAVLGLVAVPVLLVVWAYGYGRSLRTFSLLAGGSSGRAVALTLLVVVGILAGLLVLAGRISPLAPLLAGVCFVALSVVEVVSPGATWSRIPPGPAAGQGLLSLLVLGLPGLLGGLLVVVGCAGWRESRGSRRG